MDRRMAWVVAGVLAVVAVLVGLLVVGRGRGSDTQAPVIATAPPVSEPPVRVAVAATATATPVAPRPRVQRREETPAPTPVPPADTLAEFRQERFTGFVITDKEFQPVPGASVELYRFRLRDFQMRPGYPERLEASTADLLGRFRFTPRELLPSETWAYRASAPGRASAIRLFPGGEGMEDRIRASVVLPKGGEVSGVVVDEAGAPVSGALVGNVVLFAGKGEDAAGRAPTGSAWATADAEGRFTVPGVDAEQKLRLPARAEGFIEGLSPECSAGATGVRIVLARGEASLAGRVLDANGNPEPRAEVSARLTSRGAAANERAVSVTSVAEDGTFRFAALRAGGYEVTARSLAPNVFGGEVAARAEVLLQRGSEASVELQLPARTNFEGLFTDVDANGIGVGRVELFSPLADAAARQRAFRVTSAEDGTVRFQAGVLEEARGASLILPVAWPEGYFPAGSGEGVTVVQAELRFESLRPGETRRFTVPLRRGVELRGRVLLPDGTPAPGASVFFVSETYNADVTTNARGEFRHAVPRGLRLKVEAANDSGITNQRVVADAPQELELRLEALGAVAGSVTFEDGKPAPDIELRIQREETETSFRQGIRFEERGFSTADGTFLLEKVAPRELKVAVLLTGGSEWSTPEPVTITLPAGGRYEGVQFVLTAADAVEGRVVDAATGQPIPGATLITSNTAVLGQSDADGRFRLAGVPRDTPLAYVTAMKEGYAQDTRRNVSLYDADLEFRLARAGAVLVQAQDADGAPLPEFRVRLLRPGTGSGSAWETVGDQLSSDGSGEHRFQNLEPGSFRVEISTVGEAPRQGSADVRLLAESPNPLPVPVRLEAGLALRGTVEQAEDGAAVAGARVELLNPPVGRAQPGPPGAPGTTLLATTDAAGAFAFEGLPAGPYQLRAETDTAASDVVTAVLGPGSEPAVLALQASGRVFGSLTGGDGTPMRSATLILMPAEGRSSAQPVTATGGEYSLRVPRAGAWKLAVNEDGTRNSAVLPFTLTTGQDYQLDIDLSGRVLLTGTITANGSPAGADAAVLLRGAGGEVVLVPGDGGAGRYRAEALPGEYEAWLSSGALLAPLELRVTVPEGETEAIRDLTLALGSMDLVIDSPGGSFRGGNLLLERDLGGDIIPVVQSFPLERPSFRFFRLPVGTYRARLQRDGRFVADSPWTSVAPGTDTPFVLVDAAP